MEQVITNLSGRVRRAKLAGREYLVAPLTMVVPGVLNGSKGALYYPPEEIRKSVDQWNGVPIVVYHPIVNGLHVSARDPDVLNAQGIGTILRAKTLEPEGKLVAEGWFDIGATRNVDERILTALEEGNEIELSTGLFTDNEPAKDGATYNGTPYEAVARNYRADHLAILPDQVGACSVADGCGVLVNQAVRKRLGEVLGVVSGTLNQDGPSHADIRDRLNSLLRDRVGGELFVQDVFEGEVIYELKDKMWRMDYSTVDENVSLADTPPVEVLRVSTYEPVTNVTKKEEANMAMKEAERKQVIDSLVANSCCWEEEDREVLNELGDDHLSRLKAQVVKDQAREVVVNAARKGFTDPGGSNHTYDEEKKVWESKMKQPDGKSEPADNKGKEGDPPKPQTTEEWMKSAPSEIQGAVRNAITIEQREKDKLIEQLTANLKDEDQKRLRERLQGEPLDMLRDLAVLAPAKPTDDKPVSNFFGASAPAQSSRLDDDDTDILPLPTMNFEQKQA